MNGHRPQPQPQTQTQRSSSSRTSSRSSQSDATRIKHYRIGVWELYVPEEPYVSYLPSAWRVRLEEYATIVHDLPYLWRTIRDISRDGWHLLLTYALVVFLFSLAPALTLWYSGQMLNIVQDAVDHRKVDKQLLFRIAGGRVLCTVAQRLLIHVKTRISTQLNGHIKRYYSIHIFHSMARLDVPTYEDPVIARQLDAIVPSDRTSIAWSSISTLFEIASTALRVFSQFVVLVGVLSEHRDGFVLALLSQCHHLVAWSEHTILPMNGVWAATTRSRKFLKMEGLKRIISDPRHRQELVAGSMDKYLTEQYRELVGKLGDKAGDFWSIYSTWSASRLSSLRDSLQEPLTELPQIVFTLRAVQYPASIPISLVSLNLIQQSSQTFVSTISQFSSQAQSLSEQMANLRKLYEAANIPNKIPDGRMPFPENSQTVHAGVSLEFRRVSFRYAGSREYALRDVSFRIEPGQLCVIVGANGSGKSTILKLVARLYDVTEGEILVDNKNIQLLKLEDLRRAMAILFQDYTHFPLSVRDNIALGDPENAHDDERIRSAARLGGAEELISRLPEGFDTYLERPVRDLYSGVPKASKTLFGKPVNFDILRAHMAAPDATKIGLSGGQLQRLAVARTFMRSSPYEVKVGLLLFDEPSASLDPTAEHDLFARLRELRGSKTMVFSTHRFGNLTRHADVILYMNDSRILEAGTHDELLKREGDYARLWKMQAQAFL
ncbi:HlyB/MsbA family ABC transporter [Dentipellis sp. KUC8613]|nr:HlyB/MsbA family ABC transporter [Dentipellis sp. KUC8613]